MSSVISNDRLQRDGDFAVRKAHGNHVLHPTAGDGADCQGDDDMKDEAISLDDPGRLLMVYGTCCLKLGDDVGFMNIYDALRPEIAKAGGMVSSAVAEDWRQFDALRRKMVLKRRLMQGAVFVLLLVSLSLIEASTMVRLATYAIGCLVLFGRKHVLLPMGLRLFLNGINGMRYWWCSLFLSLLCVTFSWLFEQINVETHECHENRSSLMREELRTTIEIQRHYTDTHFTDGDQF